ncbi:PQQ-binding-like beta-propeller repeat protein [Prosthecobacter sp.]|jgi:outer membrane protein assembly factor BamB|uniref:outer membrane protein assembly factor BamB family protein n=1 Tax=Prosthecobacter sp. TaxID=1965333 RepID=UPI0037848DE3
MISRTLSLLLALSTPLFAENWPQWRGPRLDGTSQDTGFPISAEGNVTWKAELPGSGHASPIVWQDRLFTVAALPESEERVLLCLDRASGKLLWQSSVLKAPAEGIHKLNSLASSTPATDGERIFTAFLDNTPTEATRKANEGREIPKGEVPKGTVVISAHDFSGRPLWQVRPGLFSSKHGFCSSPILFEDKVIVNCDHDGNGYIVALSKTDGKELWRIDRPNKTRSYCVPLIREIGGRTQMVLSGTMCVASYDPHSGKLLWIIDGPTEQFVASLVFSEQTGLLYMTGGFPEHHLLAIKPDGSGNVTDTHVVWRTNKGVAYVPSPIIEGGHFLIVSDSGVAHCFDAKSGEIEWEERLREHHASLTSAEGRVYFVNDFGILRAVQPDKTYKLLAESELKEKVFASPAMSEGQIFIRTDKSLVCLGKRNSKTAAR